MNELFSSKVATYTQRRKRAFGNTLICILFPVLVLSMFGMQSLPNISEHFSVRVSFVMFWLFAELALIYAVFKIENTAIYFQNLFQLNLILANSWYLHSALNTYVQSIA